MAMKTIAEITLDPQNFYTSHPETRQAADLASCLQGHRGTVACTAAAPMEELSLLIHGCGCLLRWSQPGIWVTSICRYSNVAIGAQKWQHLNAHGYSTLSKLIVSLYFLLVMVYFIENTPACGTLVSTSCSETKKGE